MLPDPFPIRTKIPYNESHVLHRFFVLLSRNPRPTIDRDLHHRRCAGERGAGRVHVPQDGRTPGHGRRPFRGAKAGALLVLHDNWRGRGRQHRLCCSVGFLGSSIRPGALPSLPLHPLKTTPRLCLYRVPYHGSIASRVCFYGEATPCRSSATNVWETVGIRGRAAKCPFTTGHPNSTSTPSPPLSRENSPPYHPSRLQQNE